MSKQPTRWRATRGAARILAMGGAVAALVGMVSAGQALAAVAVPDERVLQRQGVIERRKALGQVDETSRTPG
jgi:phosphoribosylcarboxyaminoimidazole (NCAIR) mutase